MYLMCLSVCLCAMQPSPSTVLVCSATNHLTMSCLSITGEVGMTSLEHNVYHYLTEAAKFAASNRMKLGDPDDHSKTDVVSRLC